MVLFLKINLTLVLEHVEHGVITQKRALEQYSGFFLGTQ